MNEHLNPLMRDILNAAAKPASNYDDSHPGDCPELNMSNYDHDDVATLNGWAIQAAFCIDRLERELAQARAAIPQAVSAEPSDTQRLLFVSQGFDGYAGVADDKYDYACHVAHENGRDEPTPEDELAGLRRLIDAAMKKEQP